LKAETYLRQYKDIKTQIEIQRNRRKILEDFAALAGVDYTRVKVQSAPADTVPDIAAKLLRIDEQITRKIDQLLKAGKEIEEKISRIPDATQREVLQLRYLSCLGWEQIADKISYSLRQTFRIHSAALQAMDRILQ
jgi:DNA-directed RNA polymerase specialized sigma subunit